MNKVEKLYEKQLKLLQFLTKLDLYAEIVLHRNYKDGYTIRIEIADPGYTLDKADGNTIEEAIVKIISQRWEYLTVEQRKQIKEILS